MSFDKAMDEEQVPVAEVVGPSPCGKPCRECGSLNTTTDSVLRMRPSVLWVIFFGWYYLLIRGAFAKRTSVCRDCGATRRYKSVGSWIALGFLALIVLAVVVVALDPGI